MAHQHEHTGEWNSGLCGHVCGGDCGTCLGAWCCSCFLFGRTAQRLDQFPNTEKPELFDTNCCIMCAAGFCHMHFVVALLKRIDVRNKFGIQGNACTDCLASYFCFPCTLAQMEMQVKESAIAVQRGAPAAQGYVPQQQGMVYQPPQAQHQQHPPPPPQGYPQHQEQGVAHAPQPGQEKY